MTKEQRHAIEWAIGMASQHNIHKEPLRALLASSASDKQEAVSDDTDDDEIEPTPESDRAARNATTQFMLIRCVQLWRAKQDMKEHMMWVFNWLREQGISGKALGDSTVKLSTHPLDKSASNKQKAASLSGIAKALSDCDWSGAPIGNKAIIQAAIEALSREQKPMGGWMLVPIVPTLEMQYAAIDTGCCTRPTDTYAAMLEAAPALDKSASDAQPCAHRLVDARNGVVESGYLCVDCGAVFAAADHGASDAQPVAHGWRDPVTGCVALLAKAGTEGWERIPLYAAPRPAARDWISIEARLPDFGESVLIGFADGGVDMAYRYRHKHDKSRWSWSGVMDECHEAPTCWMPLPRPATIAKEAK